MKKLLILVLITVQSTTSMAQEQAFWNDIQAFKQQDSIQKPPLRPILFIGSSSFTMWKDLQSDFPGYTILNRGFGGSSLLDLIRYKQEIITKYKPKQIVMYCGENDFAASDTVSVNTVVGRFTSLFLYIQSKFKDIPFVYVSMKPSPSRYALLPKYTAANNIIQQYLKKFKNTNFVDVYQAMLMEDGSPRLDIFLEDNLHMNKAGYSIWQKLIAPHLKK